MVTWFFILEMVALLLRWCLWLRLLLFGLYNLRFVSLVCLMVYLLAGLWCGCLRVFVVCVVWCLWPLCFVVNAVVYVCSYLLFCRVRGCLGLASGFVVVGYLLLVGRWWVLDLCWVLVGLFRLRIACGYYPVPGAEGGGLWYCCVCCWFGY